MGLAEDQFEFKPATKEQSDTLFKELQLTEYEWDSKKLKLKKTEDHKGQNNTEDYYGWTEEDENNSAYIVAALEAYDRFRKKKNNSSGQEQFNKAIEWLHGRFKFLRPQFKFDYDQLKSLSRAIETMNSEDSDLLKELYNNLTEWVYSGNINWFRS